MQKKEQWNEEVSLKWEKTRENSFGKYRVGQYNSEELHGGQKKSSKHGNAWLSVVDHSHNRCRCR